MNRFKLEAMAEAIVHYSGYLDPTSALYQARNPGGLIAFSPLHERDDKGLRKYGSMVQGMQSLLSDLTCKLEGRSVAHLGPDATLIELARAYRLPDTTAQAWSRFLRPALKAEVNARTQISFFLQE